MDMRKGDDLMGKNVGELSEIDLKNLIEEYYMGVKTDELIRKYDLKMCIRDSMKAMRKELPYI